jgi:hypothetical protein
VREAPSGEAIDVVLVDAPTERGDGYRVLRQRDNRVEVGELRALREGQALSGEVVRLHPREEHERLFDVEVMTQVPERRRGQGPPQVANDAYRRHWEAIFGTRRPEHLLEEPASDKRGPHTLN